MSFPQTPASQSILKFQEFYRLFTTLEGSGDVYEMDVSAQAIVIGPNSDIAAINVTYADPALPTIVNRATVSLNSPLIGRVSASLADAYSGQGPKQRILINSVDVVNNLFRPALIDVADLVAFIPPRIDVIAYLAPVDVVPERRADFVTRGRVTIFDRGGGTGITWILCPYYRRKFLSVKIVNDTADPNYTVQVRGYSFRLTGSMTNAAYETDFGTTAIPAGPNAFVTVRVQASTQGLFDYVGVLIGGPATDGTLNPTLEYLIQATDEEV